MEKVDMKLSVCIATYNEEKNIGACLKAVQGIADEIVIVDGESTDRTVEIAQSFGAKVHILPNQSMFHINKQKSFDLAKGEWILYLDADEIVPPELAREITTVTSGAHEEVNLANEKLFRAHMNIIAVRDGVTYTQTPPIHGYFIARKNFFLGHYLMHSGVYPDGVIRLFKRGKGYLPCKSVHEQVVIEGGVSWLREPLVHMADPTFSRYLARANRYTSLTAKELQEKKVGKDVFTTMSYMFLKPFGIFLVLFLRHKGFMDGFSGFVWSLMSALHYPMAYMKYREMSK
jgi:glycosyltransferase involved in cell wall biosynthesis